MLLTPTTAAKVYRLRAGTRIDADGDPVEDWDNPTRKLIRSADVQLRTSREVDRSASVMNWEERSLYAPRRLDLAAEDRIEYDGEIYRVDGDPLFRRGLAMGVYTAARLVHVRGRKEAPKWPLESD